VATGASKANAEIKEIQNENTINIFTVKVMTSKNHHEVRTVEGEQGYDRNGWYLTFMNEGRSEGSNTVVKASLLIER
jgi:hypothetical protein